MWSVRRYTQKSEGVRGVRDFRLGVDGGCRRYLVSWKEHKEQPRRISVCLLKGGKSFVSSGVS